MITGGSKGIGFEIAREFASKGANLFLVARTLSHLQQARDAILSSFSNIRCEIKSCDVSDFAQVKETVKEMVEKFGTIDGLISNAGTSYPQYFEQTPIEVFERLIKVDYLGAVYFTKEVFPYLKQGSFISFTSSGLGYFGFFGYTSYSGPKFALIGFAESLWYELKLKGIQVSVLCPPDTTTPGFEEEQKAKPWETRYVSELALKELKPEIVAKGFVKQLAKGKFIINVSFDTTLIYKLHAWFPGLTQRILLYLLKLSQKAKQ